MADRWNGSDPPPRTPDDGPRLTGRYLVLGREAGDAGMPRALRDKAGLRVASASDFPQGAPASGLGGADGIYLETLGVAITASAPDQIAPLMAAQGSGAISIVEPERVLYVFDPRSSTFAPLMLPALVDPSALAARAADALVCALTAPGDGAPLDDIGLDESAVTWGLRSTRVTESRRTGRGVRVAVLDTGFDLEHPDFTGRTVVAQSFVEGETAQDEHSHGTHCVGTALGGARPATLPRYGVATEADIHVAKVLGNQGRGSDGAVLAALDWAIRMKCRIVSMSLGTATRRGDAFSQVYETVGQRALNADTLLIAAAGNESRRPDAINPVGHPANCPSILAVGAIDAQMQIATFSTRGFDQHGGGIDIVAPGVDVYSTLPMPRRHGRQSGTSMACPHVAGIAALWAEARPGASARELWQLLVRNARRLPLDAADMGAGLVQAPND